MNLEHLTGDQLAAFLREANWIIKQLATIDPNPEFQQLFDTVEKQADIIHDKLLLERVRRSLDKLQKQIATE